MKRWAPVVETVIATLGEYDFPGHHLDVRENVKSRGRHFVQWIHQTFPRTVCGLAIEFKKTFMTE